MKITLTLWQRLNLEGVILQQRQSDGHDYLTLVDFWRKIAVPDRKRQEVASGICAACGAPRRGSIWDRAKIDLEPAHEIEVEKAEARIALDILAGHKFNVADSEWFEGVKSMLREAAGYDSNPAALPVRHSTPTTRERPGHRGGSGTRAS